jgi:hypothetical protein
MVLGGGQFLMSEVPAPPLPSGEDAQALLPCPPGKLEDLADPTYVCPTVERPRAPSDPNHGALSFMAFET